MYKRAGFKDWIHREKNTSYFFLFCEMKIFFIHFVSDFIALIWANTMGALGSRTTQWRTSKWNTCRCSCLIPYKFHTRLPVWARSRLPAASENESEYQCTFELWCRSEFVHTYLLPISIGFLSTQYFIIFLLSWKIVMVDIVVNKRVIDRQNSRRNSS